MPTEPLLSSSSSSAFLSALLELSSKGGDAGVGVCRGGACEVDARQFLLHSNRSGRQCDLGTGDALGRER